MLEEVRRLQASPEAKSTMLPLLQRELYEYIRFGGYPDVVTETEEEEKIDILKDLFCRQSYVFLPNPPNHPWCPSSSSICCCSSRALLPAISAKWSSCEA